MAGLATTVAALVRRAQSRVALFSLVCVSLLMTVAGLSTLREYEQRSMELMARSLALAGEPALRFNDEQAMLDLIEQMAATAQLAEVSVTDARGAPWLQYERPLADAADAWARRLEAALVREPATAAIGEPRAPLGRISLRSDGQTLMHYGLWTGLSISLGLAATGLLVFGYSRRLATRIVAPIDALATLTRAVRDSRSFERRAEHASVRELDGLADDFNALLSELQRQQAVIEAHHADLRRTNESLKKASRHDPLTDLPNRAYLAEHLAEVLGRAARERSKVGLVFIDTDRFKAVNDSFGHAAGDALLVELSRRLRAAIRDSDFVARVGGDEFVIVITPLLGELEIEHVTDRIRQALNDQVRLPNGHLRAVSVSMGAAIFPDHADTITGLMRSADEAMYRAKSTAPGSVATFDPMDDALVAKPECPERNLP